MLILSNANQRHRNVSKLSDANLKRTPMGPQRTFKLTCKQSRINNFYCCKVVYFILAQENFLLIAKYFWIKVIQMNLPEIEWCNCTTWTTSNDGTVNMEAKIDFFLLKAHCHPILHIDGKLSLKTRVSLLVPVINAFASVCSLSTMEYGKDPWCQTEKENTKIKRVVSLILLQV